MLLAKSCVKILFLSAIIRDYRQLLSCLNNLQAKTCSDIVAKPNPEVFSHSQRQYKY